MSTDTHTREEQIRAIVRDELESQTETVAESVPYSRRDILKGAAILGTTSLGVGLGVYGAVGQAAAQDGTGEGAGTIGTSENPLSAIYVDDLFQNTDNIIVQSLTNQDYNEAVETIDPSGATETLDLSAANYFEISLGDNTDFSFTATGSAGNSFIVYLEGDFTPTWPSSVEWPDGTAPAPPGTSNVRLTFESPDGGTTWRGAESGRDFQ